jgi:hypothetical protein
VIPEQFYALNENVIEQKKTLNTRMKKVEGLCCSRIQLMDTIPKAGS